MKLEMRTLYATPERSIQPGQQAVFPPEEAERLIAGGFAVPVDEQGHGVVRARPAVGDDPEDPEDPDGGDTKVRTRPVPQPPKTPGRKAPSKKSADVPADPPTPTE